MASQFLDDDLVERLAQCTIDPSEIQKSQIRHRLNILRPLSSSSSDDFSSLSGSSILEIGCGQGDMTVVLADAVAPSGRVLAIDPAPLTYGSPFTLGQSQEAMSKSHLGKNIQWIQEDPLIYLSQQDFFPVEYFVLAHSLFYLPSEQYLGDLLQYLHRVARASQSEGRRPKLLIAEWGMRASSSAAEAHILAVKAQLAQPRSDANVRTVLEPEKVKVLAHKSGWGCTREDWIATPTVDDGAWEVGAAKRLLNKEDLNATARTLIAAMNEKVKDHGQVKSMDVWTAIFEVSSGSN